MTMTLMLISATVNSIMKQTLTLLRLVMTMASPRKLMTELRSMKMKQKTLKMNSCLMELSCQEKKTKRT